MILQQFALLNPQPISIAGIGLLKSPLLKDISPNNQNNYIFYALAMKILFDKNDELVSDFKSWGVTTFDTWSDAEIESAHKYDILTSCFEFTQQVSAAFNIFFEGKIGFIPNVGFVFHHLDDDPTKTTFSGLINKENYYMVEDLFRQLIHSEPENQSKEKKHASKKAKELWEKAHAYEKKNTKNVNSKDYDIGNIISKLCSCGIGYSVSNIYDLTIYQLYDQFAAYTQNRISRLSENAYAHWGGDNFDMNAWLKSN